MDHDVGSLEAVVDEVGSLVHIFADVEGLVVLCWDVEEVGDIDAGVTQFDSFGCSEDCLDLVFLISDEVLWRVLMFWAA